jgi:hypothetical protein
MNRRPATWDEYLFRALWHKYVRLAVVLLGSWMVFHRLSGLGYPWWLWLPAAILGAAATLLVWVILWYTYQKATQPRRSAGNKRRRQQRQAPREE